VTDENDGFLVWQGVGGVHSGAMDDEHNAGGVKRRDLMARYALGLVLLVLPLAAPQLWPASP
jgi:hypothetical protein